MDFKQDLLDLMNARLIAEIDREIMDELMKAIRGWVYFVPNIVYYVPPPTYYGSGVS